MSDGVLDTSVVVAFDSVRTEALPDRMLITTVTLAELSAGPDAAPSAAERASRQFRLRRAEVDFEPLVFDREAAYAFGQVCSSLRRAGRKTSARRFDALIAAIALAEDLPVYTCNPDDFRHMDGLQVVAVPLV